MVEELKIVKRNDGAAAKAVGRVVGTSTAAIFQAKLEQPEGTEVVDSPMLDERTKVAPVGRERATENVEAWATDCEIVAAPLLRQKERGPNLDPPASVVDGGSVATFRVAA